MPGTVEARSLKNTSNFRISLPTGGGRPNNQRLPASRIRLRGIAACWCSGRPGIVLVRIGSSKAPKTDRRRRNELGWRLAGSSGLWRPCSRTTPPNRRFVALLSRLFFESSGSSSVPPPSSIDNPVTRWVTTIETVSNFLLLGQYQRRTSKIGKRRLPKHYKRFSPFPSNSLSNALLPNQSTAPKPFI